MAATPLMVTQKDVQAFCDFCVALRAIWRHNQILFGGSDLQRELMQSVAPTFFGDQHAAH